MSSQRDIEQYLRRRAMAADYVRRTHVPGHEVTAEKDWHHAFAARPGSADHRAQCSCGWQSSTHHYGETEALASAARHIRQQVKP